MMVVGVRIDILSMRPNQINNATFKRHSTATVSDASSVHVARWFPVIIARLVVRPGWEESCRSTPTAKQLQLQLLVAERERQ